MKNSESRIDAIARLIDALDDDRVQTASAAQEELTRLLPQTTPDEAARLSPHQREALLDSLRFSTEHAWPTYHDVPFVVAVLEATPAFGDESAVPVVEALAESSAQPEVLAAATRVLPALRERATANAARVRLLRASDDTAEAERTLPRPMGPMTEDGAPE